MQAFIKIKFILYNVVLRFFTISCQYVCTLMLLTIKILGFSSHFFSVLFSDFNSLTVLFERTESHELYWSTAWNWQFYEHTLYLCSDYLIMRVSERSHWQNTYFSFLSLNHLLFCLGFCLPHIIWNDKNELWKTARVWS